MLMSSSIVKYLLCPVQTEPTSILNLIKSKDKTAQGPLRMYIPLMIAHVGFTPIYGLGSSNLISYDNFMHDLKHELQT